MSDSLARLKAALSDRYQIEREIGRGGMATVYLAEDRRHHRKVAVKVLRPELAAALGPDRFLREIEVTARLQHPNILPLLDSGDADGFLYYVMPYVDGPTLGERLANQGPPPVHEAVRTLAEIVDALAAAHRLGIVHRDVKPDNVLLTGRHAVVTDFGIAKAVTDATGRLTTVGVVIGTPAYMAPEQATGDPQLDHRVDIYAVGVLAYELLTGAPPFAGVSAQAVLSAHLTNDPEPLRARRPDIPPTLDAIVLKCLAKNPADRWPTAEELLDQLESFLTLSGSVSSLLRLAVARFSEVIRKPKVALPALAIVAVLIAVSLWGWARRSRVDWARTVALPTITRMVDSGNYYGAFQLARQAKQYLPHDPEIQAHWRTVAVPIAVRTTPPGATVYLRDYRAGEDSSTWELLGTSPLDQVSIPIGSLRWRLTKEGFDDVEVATAWAGALFQTVSFTLHRRGATPTGMVFVPGARTGSGVQIEDYWIDKYEATNRQFQEFVNAGGYQRREFWKHPFVHNGRVLSWQQAMAEFRDATGRSGPSTWELGRYPDGQADFPVTGVSWYEAAAHAEFVGKSLPTVPHWNRARATGALLQLVEGMTRLSNFGGNGPARVGSYQGISAFGAYDMAGNVREWCWNAIGDKHYSLGGAWDDPDYMVTLPHGMPPFDRSRTQGYRLVKYPTPVPEALLAPLELPVRDYRNEKPANDDVFQVYRRIYDYDRTDLNAAVESVDDSSQYWREEKITFNAAYGSGRVIAYLFLPKNTPPPYQVVVYFPGGGAFLMRSISFLDEAFSNFIVRSGRALLYPIYNDTYERRLQAVQRGPNYGRDLGIEWFKDLERSIDYLETRPDIDHQKVAFYGFSQGPHWGTIFMALDARIKVGVFLAGGLQPGRPPPESDPINFAPRVGQPVLMVNGRNDSFYPLETSQRPLFRLLGSPENHKRHVVVEDAGHVVPRQAFMKEILDWLDRYLGAVKVRQ